MKIVWTLEAENSFTNIIDYLLERWTVKEANTFIDLVVDIIEKIKRYPEMFKLSQYDNTSREAIITKHTTLFYRVLDRTIEIECFWGNFQNPSKIKGILDRN